MKKIEPLKLIKENENFLMFAGSSAIFVVLFFVLIGTYTGYVKNYYLIPLGMACVVLAYIFYRKATETKRELDKSREILIVREVLKATDVREKKKD